MEAAALLRMLEAMACCASKGRLLPLQLCSLECWAGAAACLLTLERGGWEKPSPWDGAKQSCKKRKKCLARKKSSKRKDGNVAIKEEKWLGGAELLPAFMGLQLLRVAQEERSC